MFPAVRSPLLVDSSEAVAVVVERQHLADGRGVGDLLGELLAEVQQVRVRDHVVDQPDAEGFRYVEFLRGTPLLLQLFVIYYVLPQYLGITLPEFWAGVLALVQAAGGPGA